MLMEKLVEYFKRYDFSFFLFMTAIFLIGVLNLFSATHSETNFNVRNLYLSQLLWFGLAVSVGFLVSLISSHSMMKFAYVYYLMILGLLVLVLLIGRVGMGAQRWIDLGPVHLQPSELMKLALVIVLAKWFSAARPDTPLDFKGLIIPGILAGIPALMVLVQPDLGTAALLILIFSFMAFYRNLEWNTILKLLSLGLIAAVLMYQYGLKDYQRKRIQMFINPYEDAKGSGYNAIQSEIAIGSGKFLGKGYMKSTQASLNFLPENHTDFVFSIYNEEHGFMGALFLIGLYLILLLRLLWLSRNVTNFSDSLLIVGLTAIFFWHAFINMGMVTGLLPIVGIPLPLMSYGGSSMITFGISIGLATGISNSRTMFAGQRHL